MRRKCIAETISPVSKSQYSKQESRNLRLAARWTVSKSWTFLIRSRIFKQGSHSLAKSRIYHSIPLIVDGYFVIAHEALRMYRLSFFTLPHSVCGRICCLWFLIIRTVLNNMVEPFLDYTEKHENWTSWKVLILIGPVQITYQEIRCKLIKIWTFANLTKDAGKCEMVELSVAAKSTCQND